MSWQEEYKQKLVSVGAAAGVVKSGDTIWAGPFLSIPHDLMVALGNRYQELENVTLRSGMMTYPYEFLKNKDCKGHINYKTMFVSAAETVYRENIEITSTCISESFWYIENIVKPDIYMVEVSAPDKNGYMSLGATGGMHGYQAKQSAKTVVVQVNSTLPYAYGSLKNFIHVSEVDYICETDRKLTEFNFPAPTPEEIQIAKFVAERIDDGDCVQAGLGPLLDAIFAQLGGHKDLGIHTEALMQGMYDLVEKGVITCAKKNFHPGKIVAGFYAGKQSLYDFVDRNLMVEMHPIPYTNNPFIAAKNDNYVSINGAMMIDTTGQITAESIGLNQITGLGGHLDHCTAARHSKGGKGFITMTAAYPDGKGGLTSRIANKLPAGTAITTPRALADMIVTEYGVAELKNKSIPERVKAMAAIAHPMFRDQLLKEAAEAGMLRD